MFVLGVFLIERFWIVCCGCFCDWFYDWLMRWFFVFVMFCFEHFIDWVVAGIVCRDCLMWLIVPIGCFLLNGCDFVWKKKNKGLTVHCKFPLLNPMSKWVWSDLCGCFSFDFGGYCLLWKRFCILNVALRATQVKLFAK